MTTDAQRYAIKIRKFDQAIERVGVDRVSVTIGRGAFSSFTCARDAQVRRQNPAVIATFLAEAQERGEIFCGLQYEETVYDVMATLR